MVLYAHFREFLRLNLQSFGRLVGKVVFRLAGASEEHVNCQYWLRTVNNINTKNDQSLVKFKLSFQWRKIFQLIQLSRRPGKMRPIPVYHKLFSWSQLHNYNITIFLSIKYVMHKCNVSSVRMWIKGVLSTSDMPFWIFKFTTYMRI